VRKWADGVPTLRFYSKADCSLCDAGLLVVERVAQRRGLTVEKVDIGGDDDLGQRYGERIPVVEVDGRELGSGRLSERQLAEALDAVLATRSAPTEEPEASTERHAAAASVPAFIAYTPLRRFLEAQRTAAPLLAWAALSGAIVGAVGGSFRWIVVEATAARERGVSSASAASSVPEWLLGAAISALMVAVAVWVVRRFAPEAAGSGVQEIEGALDGVRPLRWWRVLPVKFLGGILSLAAGLVVGREGPTIQMGGNLGKMLGDLFRRGKDDVHVLVAASAGAGLAAAFNAPLAGLLFVIEEMRPQFHYSAISVQAVLIACAVSDVVVRWILGGAPVIDMPVLPVPALSLLWTFLLFGAVVGAIGFLFNRALVRTLNGFQGLGPLRFALAGAAVGAAVGVLGWTAPDAVGGGYAVVARALSSPIALGTLLALFVARFGLTLVSFAAGAPGGIFAPLVAMGTLFGVTFGQLFARTLPNVAIHPDVFAVAGMGALFAATVRAPVTGIVLAVEMTGNYGQIVPLMLTCVAATVVAHGLGGRPIYTVLLERALAKTGE